MPNRSLPVAAAFAALALCASHAFAQQTVAISEVAWMGTTYSTSDEWIELVNSGAQDVSLAGWTLAATDGTPSVGLVGTIPAGAYFLLERTDDSTVPGVPADEIYTGALSNTGEVLELRDGMGTLVDSVDAWYAGDNASKATMERIDPAQPGTVAANWATATASYDGGLGTPTSTATSPPPGGGGGGGGTGSDWYSLYFTDHLHTVMPSYGPKQMESALVAALDAATTSIDFAVYGFSGADAVVDALYRAADRGVAVRGVVDSYADGFYPYRDSEAVVARLGTVVSDHDDRIMHDKFFVVDGRWVWTGSTNISRPEIDAEYYSDVGILVDLPELAGVYEHEFGEMYGGAFHDAKVDDTQHVFGPLADGTMLECYFGPSDDAETHAIVRAIDEAQSSVDLRNFYLTSLPIRDALLAAHTRGVVVRVILDADGAANEYSVHGDLRAAGIPVKVENWGGLEHEKALSVDGHVTVLGSQNFTLSGNTESDENTLYVDNVPLATAWEAKFDEAWMSIPDTWLSADPGAESPDSPGSLSDLLDNDHDGLTDEGAPESINTLTSGPGSINVYFLRQALPQGAAPGNVANYNVNLEHELADFVAGANATVDVATYELNLPDVVDALIARAAAGVTVRVIADSKDELHDDGTVSESYQEARLYYEKLLRGGVHLFADSVIFAVEDPALRQSYGLPRNIKDLPYVTVQVGSQTMSGYLLADAEHKDPTPSYYSRADQMHNKFVIVDDTKVWTGSWNFTVNDTYGSWDNRAAGVLSGNTNHGIAIDSTELADVYRTEFEEMWGGSAATPDPEASNFHARKTDNTPHEVTVGGRRVRVYFSPGDDAMGNVEQTVTNEADLSAHFSIFAFSDQGLTDALKVKWEGSPLDEVGSLTGFELQGIFERSYWNQYWSASIDMTGRQIAGKESYSVRWANPAPVYRDNEDGSLHHKYMILDVDSTSDPLVITGSTNWSANGTDTNDENLLMIYDEGIANQFYQEFGARYYMAGGRVDYLVN